MNDFDPLSRAEAFYLKPKLGCDDFSKTNNIMKSHGVDLVIDAEVPGYLKFIGETSAIRDAINDLAMIYDEIDWLCYLVTEKSRGRCLYNATPGAWSVWLDWPPENCSPST